MYPDRRSTAASWQSTSPNESTTVTSTVVRRGWRLLRTVVADLQPLRVSANYRRLWAGMTVAQLGQQMTAVAIAYQVWSLTRSSFAVGLVGAFSVVPLIAFGLYGGSLVDRFDRRLVALVASTGLWLFSLVLALQAVLGLNQVWLLYLVVAGQSGCFAVNNPARQTIVPRSAFGSSSA